MHMCAYGGQKMISGVTLRNMGPLFWDRFPHGLKLLNQPTQDIQEAAEILLLLLPYKHRPPHIHSGSDTWVIILSSSSLIPLDSRTRPLRSWGVRQSITQNKGLDSRTWRPRSPDENPRLGMTGLQKTFLPKHRSQSQDRKILQQKIQKLQASRETVSRNTARSHFLFSSSICLGTITYRGLWQFPQTPPPPIF